MPDSRDCLQRAAPLGAGAPYPGGRASTQARLAGRTPHRCMEWRRPRPVLGSCNTV